MDFSREASREICDAIASMMALQMQANDELKEIAAGIRVLVARANEAEFEPVNERLNEISSSLAVIATRATAAENRHCHAFGEGTDGARFLE